MSIKIIEASENNPLTLIYPTESKSITILVLVRIGSRYETKELGGISHFVEHMLFKSTKNRPDSKVIAMDIEMMGGISNAFTSYEYTGYFIKTDPSEYSKSIEIIADIVKNSIFKPEEFEKERGVILEEIKMYQDKPSSRVSSDWRTVFYGEDPLGRDIAGTYESVKNMKVEQLESFYKQHYFNGNFVVSIGGKVNDEEDLLNQIKKSFAGDIDRPLLYKIPKPEIKSKSEIVIQYKDLEQVHVCMGFEIGRKTLFKSLVSDLLDTILSEGFGSRLFQKLREEMGIAYYLYSDFSLFDNTGRMNIGFGTDLKKIEAVIEEVIKELNLLIKDGINETELQRAKKYFTSRLFFETENSDELAAWLGVNYIEDGKVIALEEIIKNINNITVDNVNDYIKKEFSGKKVLVSALGQLKKNLSNKINLVLD
jgi:predicted Zn-dependent peptidase